MRKVKEINGIPTIVTVPKFYTTSTETYVGDFDKQSDEIHLQEGFYTIVEPDIPDTRLQKKGELVKDTESQAYTYTVVDRVYNLDDLKNRHKADVQSAIREISQIVSDVKNIYDPLRTSPENIPAAFQDLVGQIQPLHQRAFDEINALSGIPEALDYIVKGPEIKGYIEQLKSFLTE